MTLKRKSKIADEGKKGQLRIGDAWNAITIIALSQNNPLKAIAEFVENSIDARAKSVLIIRGKAKGESYLKIIDDGQGVPLDEEGAPNFKYVATHICDSVKKKLKIEGALGIQGEFGIGLLSFWTVGNALTLSCCGRDNRVYHMRMSRGKSGYTISHRHLLTPFQGTELTITSLLSGLRQLNGEKIQRYLASELRDRIRQADIKIKVVDHFLRAEYPVEPRQFAGQLIHQLSAFSTEFGEIYMELYLNSPDQENHIGLYRSGTRVLPSIGQLDEFSALPWISGYVQGIIDAPFLNLTPGTRDGIIRDERFSAFCRGLGPLQETLNSAIDEQRRAQEERSSKHILKSVQSALKEAILSLPQEEYDWFDVHPPKSLPQGLPSDAAALADHAGSAEADGRLMLMKKITPAGESQPQRSFFDFAGPLFSVKISPSSCNMAVNTVRNFQAMARDKRRRPIEQNITYEWRMLEGQGILTNIDGIMMSFQAPSEPGLVRLGVRTRQEGMDCESEAIVTVTDSIFPEEFKSHDISKKGLPGYTLKSAPGESWRSRYDKENNLVVINNAHRDFVFASKEKSRKLRYICRLFIKELILANFINIDPVQLLERMVELSLYTEESLK